MIVDRLVSLTYWCLLIGWAVVVPVSAIGFFAGGWFVLAMYACAWDAVKRLRTDMRSLPKSGPQASAATRMDYLLARTEAPPPRLFLQLNGEQDIGNFVGSQDLGYTPVHIAVPRSPRLLVCPACFARYEHRLPDRCRFCGFGTTSTP